MTSGNLPIWTMVVIGAIASVVWAEAIRDLYHVVAHRIPKLYRWHVWHHRVFRQDLTPFNDRIYRQAQWYHDLPESLVMLAFGAMLGMAIWLRSPALAWGTAAGLVYSLTFLFGAIVRGSGVSWARDITDLTHLPGPFLAPPSPWFVNRTYHWRHHFDNQNAYFCGALTWVDKLMGTALSLKGKTIAVTGASGTLGRSLLAALTAAEANVIAVSSKSEAIAIEINGETVPIKTVTWQVGNETALADLLENIDILVVNHGINVHDDRTPEAIEKSYQINAFSGWRLLELFLKTVRTNTDIAKKEVWINTSEAEATPAFSPLYELSKRTLGDLITLRRLDAPCTIRKLILGPFKSNLNPIGIMSAEWVGKQIVKKAKAGDRNIIVTINPLTFVAFPLKEFFVSLYFRWFTR